MSIRDPFYIQIKEALGDVALDTDLFEQLAAELVESKGYPTNVAVGGADNGYDFELLDDSLEPGPGVATTSNRVTGNLKRNLDSNLANCPRAAKKTYVVTSTVLTHNKRTNLKQAAHERGYRYLGASDQHDVARYIYSKPQWARDLLGLTGHPSALSVVPRTSRPLMDIPHVGRKHIGDHLRRLNSDALLVGTPGSGKTALLSSLVSEGIGSFLVSTDESVIANAIREQRPQVVIIDDLDDVTATTRDLVRLRTEIGADFQIIVTDWEKNPGIKQSLGITESNVITLERLTRDEIVNVVASMGVIGPRRLVREIANQAEGVPGLAVTLTQAALAGDLKDLFDGNSLGSLMESTVSRLLGSPREGDQAVLGLGAIAMAGDAGLTLEETAEFVGISKAEVQSLLRRLTSGGIIRSDHHRVTLRPRPLRGYMIRKTFFDVGPADYNPLLTIVPNKGEAAKELVLAFCAGAVIPGLLNIVLSSGNPMAARYYAGSGERQACELLTAAPHLAIQVAIEALHSAPKAVIPLLLDLAVDDTRELHNTPEHPLRLIKDWANLGVPDQGDAIARKRTTVQSAIKWAASDNDFYTACRACSEVLRTVYESHETDPGIGATLHITKGMLTDKEITQLCPIWRELHDAIATAEEVPWLSLLSACWDLIHPHVFGNPPEEAFEQSRRFGEKVVEDLGNLAVEHPGVLDCLNTMRRELGHDELYSVPEDYIALFGEHRYSDSKKEEQERSQMISKLAEKWAAGDAEDFASRMKWLQKEAGLAGRCSHDRSPALCRLVAKQVDEPARWLSVLVEARISPPCVLSFLEAAIECRADEWEKIATPILEDHALEQTGIEVALRAADLSDTMWSVLHPRLDRSFQLVQILCLRNQVPLPTLRRLLHHESAEVTHATAVGMWTGKPHGVIPEELRQEWENAVAGIADDEYWLKEMLASSPTLAARWLRSRIENNDWRALSNKQNVQVAAEALDNEQRLEMLRNLPERSHYEKVAEALIGNSDYIYRQVVRERAMHSHWRDPLKREADEVWRLYVEIALEEGLSSQEIAEASRLNDRAWSGPESVYLQGQIDDFAKWQNDPNEGIKETSQLVIKRLSASRERALIEERERAIEGL